MDITTVFGPIIDRFEGTSQGFILNNYKHEPAGRVFVHFAESPSFGRASRKHIALKQHLPGVVTLITPIYLSQNSGNRPLGAASQKSWSQVYLIWY